MEYRPQDEKSVPMVTNLEIREGEDKRARTVLVLRETNGVVAGSRGAAPRLGVKRTMLLSRLMRLGID